MSISSLWTLMFCFFLIFCLHVGCIKSKTITSVPICRVDNVASCSVSEFSDSNESLQRQLRKLSIGRKIPKRPLDFDKESTRIQRNENTTNTTVVLKYFGKVKEFRRFKAIFIKVQVYQGPQSAPAEKWLLAKLSGFRNLINSERYFTIHISNIIIPIHGTDFLGKMYYTWLPCSTKRKDNLDDCSFEVDNIPVLDVSKNRISPTKGYQDRCIFPNVTLHPYHNSKSIDVKFCGGNTKVIEVKVKNTKGTTVKRLPNLLESCNMTIRNLLTGAYTVDLIAVCDKTEYVISKKTNISSFQQEIVAPPEWLSSNYYVIAIIVAGTILVVTVLLFYRQSRFSVKRAFSLLFPSIKQKMKELANDRTARKGTMVITLRNDYYTRHLLKFLHSKSILVRNILDLNEGMRNWMDWIEQGARLSQNYLFIVTEDLYELYRRRRDHDLGNMDSQEKASLLGMEPCLYALTLARLNIAHQSRLPIRYRQKIHLLCFGKSLSKKFRKLHPVFQGPGTYCYIIPSSLLGNDLSKSHLLRKLIKRLEKSEGARKDTSIEVDFTLPIDVYPYKINSMERHQDVNEIFDPAASEKTSTTLLPSIQRSLPSIQRSFSTDHEVLDMQNLDSNDINGDDLQNYEKKSTTANHLGGSRLKETVESCHENIRIGTLKNYSSHQTQYQQHQLCHYHHTPTGTYSAVDGSINPDRPIQSPWYCRECSGSLGHGFPYPVANDNNLTYLSSSRDACTLSQCIEPASKCSAVHGSSAPTIDTETDETMEEKKATMIRPHIGSPTSSVGRTSTYTLVQCTSITNEYGLLSDETSRKQVQSSDDSGFETRMDDCFHVKDQEEDDDLSYETDFLTINNLC